MLEDMGREQMRAADADRQRVADQLHEALGEGRLDLHEYDERLRDAYAAKTYADLDRLLADLPNAAPVAAPVPAPVPEPAPLTRREGGATSSWLAQIWRPWAKGVAFFNLLWLAGVILANDGDYYWPGWIIGPWTFFVVLRTLAGLANGEPRKHARAEELRHLRREHKRERKALEARAVASGQLPRDATKQQRKAFIAEAVARGDLPPKPRLPETGKTVN